jgi:hypothetical protein
VRDRVVGEEGQALAVLGGAHVEREAVLLNERRGSRSRQRSTRTQPLEEALVEGLLELEASEQVAAAGGGVGGGAGRIVAGAGVGGGGGGARLAGGLLAAGARSAVGASVAASVAASVSEPVPAPVMEAEAETPCVVVSPELSPHAASRTRRTGERGAGLRMSASITGRPGAARSRARELCVQCNKAATVIAGAGASRASGMASGGSRGAA